MKLTTSNAKVALVSSALLLVLAGCAKKETTPVASTTVESSSSQVKVVENTADFGTKANYPQLEVLLKQSNDVKLKDSLYQTEKVFNANQENFDVTIDMAKVYQVEQVANKELESEFNFESKPGALVVLHVQIKNKTSDKFYFPIEELKLSFNDATLTVAPSFQLYPADAGNLALQLSDNQGLIEAGATAEGYLVYGLGGDSFEQAKQDGFYYLDVLPPKRNTADIAGVGANALGDERLLYLPLNSQTEASLLESQTHLADRLTTEYWGQKTILADEKLQDKQSGEGINVTLNRLEVSDFTPNTFNEAAFRNFKYGAVIVTVEYQVTNNTQEILLPVDGVATLTINGDPITSDYVLTNQVYGKELAPGQSMRVMKTFALDKKRYQENWQGHPYDLSIAVMEKGPEVDSGSVSSSDSSSTTEAIAAEPKKYELKFSLTPKLLKQLNAELQLDGSAQSSATSESTSANENSSNP